MKRYLSILLVALMMFSVLFVSISCNQEKNNNTPTPAPTPEFDAKAHDGRPILPKGTGQVIPSDWSVDQNGKTGLPDFVTDGSKTNVTAELKAALKSVDQSFFAETPKNVIVIIGDGMGLSHLKASREYKGELVMDLLPYQLEGKTNSYPQAPATGRVANTTTDSCAGGSQILTGYKTRYGYIALDIDGNEIQTLGELAKKNGWKTAVVTNDNIADATPADTIVHNTSRYHDPVIYYQELMECMPDLLMGWDWGMGHFFSTTYDTWAKRLNEVENDAMVDACSGKHGGDISKKYSDGGDPIAYYNSLTTDADKEIAKAFSVYYHIYSTDDSIDKTAMTYEQWLTSSNGLAKWCSDLDASFGAPKDKINRKTRFSSVLGANFQKPILASWTSDSSLPGYDEPVQRRGYLIQSNYYPNYSEMVAFTLYQMDKMANDSNTGFFAMIENTCTDGWGHCHDDYGQKVPGILNEVQCCDEGVAIAVKYVLEHPDTLLVVTADHETGGFDFEEGWENDYDKILWTTTGHSSQNVPVIAFGAGAQKFSSEAIAAAYPTDSSNNGKVIENWITGQIIGKLMKANMTGGSYDNQEFGQPEGYPNNLK